MDYSVFVHIVAEKHIFGVDVWDPFLQANPTRKSNRDLLMGGGGLAIGNV